MKSIIFVIIFIFIGNQNLNAQTIGPGGGGAFNNTTGENSRLNTLTGMNMYYLEFQRSNYHPDYCQKPSTAFTDNISATLDIFWRLIDAKWII